LNCGVSAGEHIEVDQVLIEYQYQLMAQQFQGWRTLFVNGETTGNDYLQGVVHMWFFSGPQS
jgi:hypothetical protein